MREILFRGKSTENGEWEYGVPFFEEDYETIKGQTFICANIIDHYSTIYDLHRYCEQVIADTLGQYTGLTDKNGKEIFEGDIVIWKFENHDTDIIADVIFYNGGFCLKNKDSILDCYPALKICDMWSYEVIGNIYDNPKLLEV